MIEREGAGGVRERQRQRQRKRQRERHRQTDRQTDRDRESITKSKHVLVLKTFTPHFVSPILGLFKGLPGKLD